MKILVGDNLISPKNNPEAAVALWGAAQHLGLDVTASDDPGIFVKAKAIDLYLLTATIAQRLAARRLGARGKRRQLRQKGLLRQAVPGDPAGLRRIVQHGFLSRRPKYALVVQCRHGRPKPGCRKACGFESHPGHHMFLVGNNNLLLRRNEYGNLY